MEGQEEGQEDGVREPITPEIIGMIARNIGLGAIVLDLGKTDYTRGAMTTKDGKCFWLTNGCRVDISMTYGGGLVGSVTKEADPNLPEPL